MAFILLGGLWACDIPTEAPEWDQRWIVPGEETTVKVETLLPDGLTVTPDGSAFSVDVEPVSFSESLGNLCAPCGVLNGLVAPKPPFLATIQETAFLPDEVSEATVQEGRITISVRNGMAFDPVRPAAGVTGTLTASLRDQSSSGILLDQVVVDGATESFSSGTTKVRQLEFSGAIQGPLVVVVEVNSPTGDPVLIDTSETVGVDAVMEILEVTSAEVDVSGQEFTLEEADMDLEELDETLVDHIISAALDMEIDNPWSVGASVTLTIYTMGTNITKDFNVSGAGMSTARVEFTQSELRSFMGQPNVTLGGTGVVMPGPGEVLLTPDQVLTMDSTFDLVVRVGGGGS